MCRSAMDLGITWISYILKKSNKTWTEVGIKIKHISMLNENY